MKRFLLLFLTIIFLMSCNKLSEDYFNAEIFTTDISNIRCDTLIGEIITLKDIYAGYMTVYDSMMLFVSHSFPDYYLYIYNLNNNELIGKYAHKGQGPDDYIDFTHAEQFIINNKDIKLWVRNGYGAENILINITNTINTSKFIIDSTLYLNWKKNSFVPFGYVFMAHQDKALTRIQAERIEDNSFIPDRYEVYNMRQEFIQKIEIFNKPILKKQNDFPVENYFVSRDRIKPDGTKIVMAMEMLAQLNIYDINNDKLKGFRIKGTPDFDYLLRDTKNYRIFFRDVCVDNEYIYALYSNTIIEENGKNYPFETNSILVYDWDGEITRIIILDKKTHEITIDPISKYLYILTFDDLIYKYAL